MATEDAHLLLLHAGVVFILLRNKALHAGRVATYVGSALFHLSDVNGFGDSDHRVRAKLASGLILVRVSTLDAAVAHGLTKLQITLSSL